MELKHLNAVVDGAVDLEDLVIGQLIKVKRKARRPKMSLADLAEKIHYSQSHLSGIENIGKEKGAKSIKRLVLRSLLEGLGEDYDHFMEEVKLILKEAQPYIEMQKKTLHPDWQLTFG